MLSCVQESPGGGTYVAKEIETFQKIPLIKKANWNILLNLEKDFLEIFLTSRPLFHCYFTKKSRQGENFFTLRQAAEQFFLLVVETKNIVNSQRFDLFSYIDPFILSFVTCFPLKRE